MSPISSPADLRTTLNRQLILCVGGWDPSGSAGLIADLQVVQALGGHAAGLVTLQTVQGRRHWRRAEGVPLALLQDQFAAICADLPVAGVKIGAVANPEQAAWLREALSPLAVPKVLDPVLHSTSGGSLSSAAGLQELAGDMDLCTPNRAEAAALFGLDAARPAWTDACPVPLLVTAGDESGDTLHNRLLSPAGNQDFHWPRRAGNYRGSGCRLSTAICCYLVAGLSLPDACHAAQALLQAWIDAAWPFPDGQHLPRPPA